MVDIVSNNPKVNPKVLKASCMVNFTKHMHVTHVCLSSAERLAASMSLGKTLAVSLARKHTRAFV